MKTEFANRYAIYFAPALHSPWWAAGSHWLGRCAATGQSLKQPLISGIEANAFRRLTQEPRRYGWHATLKAPFELRPEHSVASLLQAVQDLAQDLPAFDLPPLQVSSEGDFMALRPAGDVSAIEATADACVTRLHGFAKPLSPADLARRRQSPLTPAQDQMLVQWGYPWVLDEFKFHLSLTGPLHQVTEAERQALTQAAQAHFETLPPCRFGHMALFVEPKKGADFQWLHSVALRA
jgi:putative phosphonate metabolism protein